MKKFMVIYHAPADAVAQMANATTEQKAEGMKPWLAWKDSVGDKLLDFGAPLMGGTRLLSDGSTELSKKEVTGYSLLQASDMEEAKSLLSNHPHLAWTGGCDIEVHECIEM
jgi:hypothetical protein